MLVLTLHATLIILRLGKTKVAKEKFFGAKNTNKINIWDLNVDTVVISKLAERRRTNSKYLIGCLDKVIRSLFLHSHKKKKLCFCDYDFWYRLKGVDIYY